MSVGVRVGDVDAAVLGAFPKSWAEPWDAVGLRVGDPDEQVTRVLVTLDATLASIDHAKSLGANVLVTHHPPALGEHATFTPQGPGATLFHAASAGIAVLSAHTNLDRSPDGAPVLLRALGIEDGWPLEKATMECVMIVAYAPKDHADALRASMAEAGAGRIGEYEGCSFTVQGDGRFTPPAEGSPFSGVAGQPSSASEERIEMICGTDHVDQVLGAAKAAHPYEEPLLTMTPLSIARGQARLGHVADLKDAVSLEHLVDTIAETFDCTPRVWGQRSGEVSRLATMTGSGGSMVAAAVAAKADALLLGEVRYHEVLDATAQGLAVIEAGHDVTEWPLVPVLAQAVLGTSGLDPGLVITDGPSRAYWTP